MWKIFFACKEIEFFGVTCPWVGSKLSLVSIHYSLDITMDILERTQFWCDVIQHIFDHTHNPLCLLGFGATPHSQLSSNFSCFLGWPFFFLFFFLFFFFLFFFFSLYFLSLFCLPPIRCIVWRFFFFLISDKTKSLSFSALSLTTWWWLWLETMYYMHGVQN